MEKLKIELSQDQYKTLLKLVYLGEWVSQSYNEEPSTTVEVPVAGIVSVSTTFFFGPDVKASIPQQC